MIFTERFIRQCFAANERIPQKCREGSDAFHHVPNPRQGIERMARRDRDSPADRNASVGCARNSHLDRGTTNVHPLIDGHTNRTGGCTTDGRKPDGHKKAQKHSSFVCLLVSTLFCSPSCGSISKAAFPSDPASRGRDRCEQKTLPFAHSRQCRNCDANSPRPQRTGNKIPSTNCRFSCPQHTRMNA
jgi:hypothetical protein